jgi:integrase
MADELLLMIELAAQTTPECIKPTLKEACDKFLDQKKAQHLSETSLSKYRLLFERLTEFARQQNLVELTDVSPDVLNRFRQTWTFSATTANRRIEGLRSFFRFCIDCGWITVNSARALKRQRADTAPREPFTEEEVKRILSACEQYPRRGGVEIARLKAFVQLLLDTGLRIGDAVRLERRNVVDGRLRIRTAKTGVHVSVPLTLQLADRLNGVIGTSSCFYFWSGAGKLKSAIGDWQRSLSRLFKLAAVPNACAHRFRHTAAKRLLMSGIPIERVAVLLGHSSSTITMKHYANWIPERQEQLEADVRLVQQKFA